MMQYLAKQQVIENYVKSEYLLKLMPKSRNNSF